LLILIIGWIVAVGVRAGIRRLLAMAKLNSRIAQTTEQKIDLESGVSAGAFWLIILVWVRAQCGRQATHVTGARTTSLS